MLGTRVSHSGGAWGGGAPSILRFFSNPLPSPQNQCPPWASPHLKMKPPSSDKQTTPIETWIPVHEMISRKSTINNNLKSSENPWKICVKKFIFSKFGGLLAYSQQLYYQMNSFTGIFRQHKLPHASPMFWCKPPPSNFEEALILLFSCIWDLFVIDSS